MEAYPKRLIEIDLPIREISAHARREKSIRHGHISTLHMWWARRPLAACRAVICASLWPDPADPLCPEAFTNTARSWLRHWANNHLGLLCPSAYSLFVKFQREPHKLDDPLEVRAGLLAFIADFANWDNSANTHFVKTSQALTQASHEALEGVQGTRALVVDPFAGGGAIPLEALRVGGDAFASDWNPLPIVLNRVTLQYIPRFGQQLAELIRIWGSRIQEEAESRLSSYYPLDSDGSRPAAYVWARTIRCEGPGCGAEIPLIKSLWLCRKTNKSIALRLLPDSRMRRVDFEIIHGMKTSDLQTGTVRLGSATCPLPDCGYTTPKKRVREQLAVRRGGAADARLIAVVTIRSGVSGKEYRLPTKRDLDAVEAAKGECNSRVNGTFVPDQGVPQERVWKNQPIRVHLYGMLHWRDLFTPRQTLALSTLAQLVKEVRLSDGDERSGLGSALRTCLALSVSRQCDYMSSLCRWRETVEAVAGTFGRQALSMIWNFLEVPPFAGASGSFAGALEWVARVCEAQVSTPSGQVVRSDARQHPLPDQSTQAVVTDPPYYDAVPYAAVADYFYVWLRLMLQSEMPDVFQTALIDKTSELVVDEAKSKDHVFYELGMSQALAEASRILIPSGVCVVVFAHLSTDGWEAMLNAVLAARLTITASWPIDTERGARLRAMNSAALGSSVHLVCRPRRTNEIGDWRHVIQALPQRMHQWMPRLAAEGVVGADAIFACLGPALEIFSQYERVEKASGESVQLREYLEQVWAAVAREALNLIFEGADASGLEEDARLTAMWLWTLSTGTNGKTKGEQVDLPDDEADEDEDDGSGNGAAAVGFGMEFDTARKIAQGLGVHLDRLVSVVHVKGDSARLLPVAERARWLFEEGARDVQQRSRRPKAQQLTFLSQTEKTTEDDVADVGVIKPGQTTLDQVHQAMLLFAAGRSEVVKRLLVDEGVGGHPRFWKLAQALSALYPAGTDEKRWVDGVLARKKGLGF